MNRPFKNLPMKKVNPFQNLKNWNVVKLVNGRLVRNLMVGLTRAEAEGVARAGNARFRKTGNLIVQYKIVQDAAPIKGF